MEDDLSDAEVMQASQADPAMFRVIFERHHSSVFRFAARRVGRDTARDVASEIFVRAFANRYRYNTDHVSALPWLYGIAVNVIGDHLRKQRRAARFRLPFRQAADSTWESDNRLVAGSVSGALGRALGELKEPDRNTFLLYALEGLSYAEIAQVLDVPVGTVGSRVFRARRSIRKLIPDLELRVGSFPPAEQDRDE